MDYDALLKQFGGSIAEQPQQQNAAPWSADLSRKDQAEIKMKMYQEGRKRLADLQSQVAEAGSTMADLEQFGALNRRSSTGSWWQQLTPDKPMFRSDDSQRMNAITARLAPNQRPTGAGATSDKDIALYLQGLPSTDNEGPVNQGIREDYARRYKAALEKANAMQAHLDQYGHLSDFDSRWAQRNAAPANVRSQADAILKGK